MNLVKYVNEYLEEKRLVWSQATYRSECSRLKRVQGLLELPALTIFSRLKEQGSAPYTIKTIFIRLGHFAQWCIDQEYTEEPNKFQVFLKRNPQLFRNAYQNKTVDMNYADAARLIKGIENLQAREHATFLLKTGIRLHESYILRKRGRDIIEVTGKGGKTRRVFASALPTSLVPATTLQRQLKVVGLTPHLLRKLFATQLLNDGRVEIHELCKIMGWASVQTALKYLQPKSEDQLSALIGDIT